MFTDTTVYLMFVQVERSTIDEDLLTDTTVQLMFVQVEGRTMDEEVFTDTTGISTFRQTLFYMPEDIHNNKTLWSVKREHTARCV